MSHVDEEDDLDDLDDIVDQFDQSTPANASTAANASATHDPAVPKGDFEAELTRQMESLLSDLKWDLGGKPEGAGDVGAGDATEEREQERERARLSAAWEAMLIEEMNSTMSNPPAFMSQSGASSSGSAEANFQSRVRSTVNRLRESESGLNPSDPSASAEHDTFQSLLESFGELGDGEQSEERIQGMLEAMMGQLMSRDVLYEPLKELHEKFPAYLAEHANTILPQDRTRYEAQMACIKRLINEFEAPGFRDDDEKAREKIVVLMSELQTHGSPPEEIMGPLPPGFGMGTDGLPEVPGECNMN